MRAPHSPSFVVVSPLVLAAILIGAAGCEKTPVNNGNKSVANGETKEKPTQAATADPQDVNLARERIKLLGDRAKCAPPAGDLLTEIVMQEGSKLSG